MTAFHDSDPAPPDDEPDRSADAGRSEAGGETREDPLHRLATELGVLTRYVDGLGREVEVPTETLLAVCATLGPAVEAPEDATAALVEVQAARADRGLPRVIVAWDGEMGDEARRAVGRSPDHDSFRATLTLEDGTVLPMDTDERDLGGPAGTGPPTLPPGYHRLRIEGGDTVEASTVISTPRRAWHPADRTPSWGLSAHVAAMRSRRSRSVGDLHDLETFARWTAERGGDLVAVLPLLPTFNRPPSEPSPYAPVSRLFWSELVLDLETGHRATPRPSRIEVGRADEEVRAALAHHPDPDPALVGPRLRRYARFRGAQARLGRNWRSWPADARSGSLSDEQVDPLEERFHLVAQLEARRQLHGLRDRLAAEGLRIGLDLAVGVHPDGFESWSRPSLFAPGMSVGAPPDRAFPSGQDWGFSPVDPRASRGEGHAYVAASIAHQASVAGVLRVDHVMSLTRLFWIPQGGDVRDGTYVRYPMEELFAVLVLESHRHRCEMVGENLGTVPPEIDEALPRHAIHGMFLAQFEAERSEPEPPAVDQVAMIGNHDTATLAGWMEGRDINERVACGLLDPGAAEGAHEERASTVARLMETLCGEAVDPDVLLEALLGWMGGSASPLVVPWVEDLWLEPEQVNVPGTRSQDRPNWQRPWARLLDDVVQDPEIRERLRRLDRSRRQTSDEAVVDP